MQSKALALYWCHHEHGCLNLYLPVCSRWADIDSASTVNIRPPLYIIYIVDGSPNCVLFCFMFYALALRVIQIIVRHNVTKWHPRGRGCLKLAKKCDVFLEWPLMNILVILPSHNFYLSQSLDSKKPILIEIITKVHVELLRIIVKIYRTVVPNRLPRPTRMQLGGSTDATSYLIFYEI